ncbi:hypothetical protein LCGC14_2587950 [marine sediment metagenome]|uniref:GIY-YIG domain-containing protein n=1 Tax=marine sediment metagenome TaxID=412755 RepID=A0A0F9D5A2_9ZZZZ
MAKALKHNHSAEDLKHDQYKVYLLVCPIDNTVKYIGCSTAPVFRFTQHFNEFKWNVEFTTWLRNLKMRDTTPILKVIASFKTKKLATKYENYLIKEYGPGLLCKEHTNVPVFTIKEHLNNL